MSGAERDRAVVRRSTWQREAVRAALAETGSFISAQALHQHLAAHGTRIGLATVYRALASLAEADEADTLQSVDGEARYRACEMAAHHHHLICRECGRAEEITAEPVEAWAAEVARAHGFVEPRHVVDVFGLCPDCAAARDAGAPGR